MIGGVKSEVPTQALYGLVTLHFNYNTSNPASGGGILYHNNWVITSQDVNNGGDVQVLFAENIANQQIVENIPANVRSLNHGFREGIVMVKLPGPFLRDGDPIVSRAVLNRNPAPLTARSLHAFGRGHSQFGPSGEPDDVVGPKEWHGEDFTVTDTEAAQQTFEVKAGQFGALMVAGDSGGPFFSDDDNFVFYGNHQWSEWSNAQPSRPVLSTQVLIAPYADQIDAIANS